MYQSKYQYNGTMTYILFHATENYLELLELFYLELF